MNFQTKLHRQEEPYPSNCTRSWTRTNFTELMNDPEEGDDSNDNALRYNMAVRIKSCIFLELAISKEIQDKISYNN